MSFVASRSNQREETLQSGCPCSYSSENAMHFSIIRQSRESLDMMNKLRQDDCLCDVVLNAEGTRISAHRLVLSAASSYFRAMFCKGMKEGSQTEVNLKGIKPSTLETLVDYAYTSEIAVSDSNICDLLSASSMYEMSHVVDSCCAYLEHRLDPSNCIGVADFAQTHGCTELYAKATAYLFRNFSQVRDHEEFKQLSFPQLMHLIKHDELSVRCESEVFEAVINWIKYDENVRLNKLEELITAVRCRFLTPSFLNKQIKYCSVLDNSCKVYLNNILKDLTLHKPCTDRRRNPTSPLVLYVIGGYLRHSLSTVEYYNPSTRIWQKLSDLQSPRSGIAAVVAQDVLYVLGGRNNSPDGSLDSAEVHCYEPCTNSWRVCQQMSVPRNRAGACVVDDQIYVVGGSHATAYHESAERYDSTSDTWTNISPMKTARMGAGVAQVNRLIFAIGGFDGHDRLNSVERYCPDKDRWHQVSAMRTKRSGSGVAVHEQFIYVVGGYDSHEQLNVVERYDTERGEWTTLAPMSAARSALSCCVLNGKLYALGGFDSNDILNIVEAFNLEEGTWSEETRMSCGRSGHGCAVGSEPCFE